MMSLYLALARAGHLKQLYHIFKYLKTHHKITEIMFNQMCQILIENNILRYIVS